MGDCWRCPASCRSENPTKLCLVAERRGELLGYLLARPGRRLISARLWAALQELEWPEWLLEGLAWWAPGQRLRIGVLESNTAAVALLRSLPGLLEGEPG